MSPIRIHHRTKRSLVCFSFIRPIRKAPLISLSSLFFQSIAVSDTSSIKRQVVCPPRAPRRRRHNIRPEAIIAPRVINFDSLPWISALDDPVLTAGNPWDSDLSGLASAEYMRVSGLGPVQTKETVTLLASKFGSKPTLSEEFMKKGEVCCVHNRT